jgi:hypothetical protein
MEKIGLTPQKNHNPKVIKEASMINSAWTKLIMVITPKTKLRPQAANPYRDPSKIPSTTIANICIYESPFCAAGKYRHHLPD